MTALLSSPHPGWLSCHLLSRCHQPSSQRQHLSSSGVCPVASTSSLCIVCLIVHLVIHLIVVALPLLSHHLVVVVLLSSPHPGWLLCRILSCCRQPSSGAGRRRRHHSSSGACCVWFIVEFFFLLSNCQQNVGNFIISLLVLTKTSAAGIAHNMQREGAAPERA
jgi:hypothetical protein